MSFVNHESFIKFPYDIKECEGEIKEQFVQHFQGQKSGFVEIGTEKWILPEKFNKCADQIYNFQARADDVWIVTYPRSGTTWTQEMVWLICNDLDYETAQKITLNERFPFFEFHLFMHDQMKETFLQENGNDLTKQNFIETISVPGFEFFAAMTKKRFIKSHLPFKLLPFSVMKNRSKIVYIARNPKSIVVSYFHLNKLFRTQGFVGDFETFYNYFEKDLLHWSPYFAHIKEGWEHRHDDNVLFLFYEDMTKNLEESLRKISDFFGKPLNDCDMPKLLDHLNIKNFKNNPAINSHDLRDAKVLVENAPEFIRNGNEKNNTEMSVELSTRIDKWIEMNLKDSDFRFPV